MFSSCPSGSSVPLVLACVFLWRLHMDLCQGEHREIGYGVTAQWSVSLTSWRAPPTCPGPLQEMQCLLLGMKQRTVVCSGVRSSSLTQATRGRVWGPLWLSQPGVLLASRMWGQGCHSAPQGMNWHQMSTVPRGKPHSRKFLPHQALPPPDSGGPCLPDPSGRELLVVWSPQELPPLVTDPSYRDLHVAFCDVL